MTEKKEPSESQKLENLIRMVEKVTNELLAEAGMKPMNSPQEQILREKNKRTTLEDILSPTVSEQARVLVMRYVINDYDNAFEKVMQDYVRLIECCARETGETFEERTKKVGYHTALITNTPKKKNVETILETLYKLELVEIHNKIVSETRINAYHPHDKTKAHPKEIHCAFSACYSYKITDYGKKLLEEHRERKSEKGERKNENASRAC